VARRSSQFRSIRESTAHEKHIFAAGLWQAEQEPRSAPLLPPGAWQRTPPSRLAMVSLVAEDLASQLVPAPSCIKALGRAPPMEVPWNNALSRGRRNGLAPAPPVRPLPEAPLALHFPVRAAENLSADVWKSSARMRSEPELSMKVGSTGVRTLRAASPRRPVSRLMMTRRPHASGAPSLERPGHFKRSVGRYPAALERQLRRIDGYRRHRCGSGTTSSRSHEGRPAASMPPGNDRLERGPLAISTRKLRVAGCGTGPWAAPAAAAG